MLDLGFIDPIMKIAAATPKSRQTLFFSATFEGKVRTIAKELLRNPASVHLSSNRDRHTLIQQQVYQADDGAHKHRLLTHHLNDQTVNQALIFTATKRGADRLAKKLANEGLTTAALHGDMRQGARNRTVDSMRSGRLRFLVATDVAARGLDIKGISHVFNYDLPRVPEDYIHRIGRTGRAGVTGAAISFVGPGDWSSLNGIERLTGQTLKRDIVPGLEPQLPEPRKEVAGKARNGKPFRPFRNNQLPRRNRGRRRVFAA
jgi:superfamily II DNA/RNA helicase